MHDVPFETQVDPQSKHWVVVVPWATVQEVNKAHEGAADPAAGNHPQFPSVPIMQLA